MRKYFILLMLSLFHFPVVLQSSHTFPDEENAHNKGHHASIKGKEKCTDDLNVNECSLDVSAFSQPQGKYWLLNDLPNDESKYIISVEPINSSGDFYHILAYIILAKSYGKEVPEILLTYDGVQKLQENESSMNTYTQVDRSLNFAEFLGYRGYFHAPAYVNAKSHHASSRRIALNEYLKNKEYTYYIDQKALTTLIASSFIKNGSQDTITRLRTGFNKFSDNYSEVYNEISDMVNCEIKKINNTQRGKPLVIMHMRYSSKANNHQNFKHHIIETFAQYIEFKYGYNIWYIFTDGRKASFEKIGEDIRTDPFPCKIKDKDYGKAYHLQLLLQLINIPNLKGIIGNTSGTLDLAAFVGHKVYNWHKLEKDIDYQCCRILIQSAFLTVDMVNEEVLVNDLKTKDQKIGNFSEKVFYEHFPNFHSWQDQSSSQTLKYKEKKNLKIILSNTKKSGLKGLFFLEKIKVGTLIQLSCYEDILSFLENILVRRDHINTISNIKITKSNLFLSKKENSEPPRLKEIKYLVNQSPEYTVENFKKLLSNLSKLPNLSDKKITVMAGYSGANSMRDFKSMIEGKCKNPEEKWKKLIESLQKENYSVNKVLK